MADSTVDILTPQGYLSETADDPNLDVVMNLFKIPRAFAVSGFGNWSVGQHCFCVAFLALYWARHRGFDAERCNRLMVMGLTHDLHEAATGDILPALKNPPLREQLNRVQARLLAGLRVAFDQELQADLKVLDRVAFLYEIRRAAVLDQEQRTRLSAFFRRQHAALLRFAAEQGFTTVEAFLAELGVFDPGQG